MDDLVLDVGRFMSEHPGGQFLIQFHSGRDISKFFYGGYVLENESGMQPHTHSNVARTIVNSLVIGKLHERAQTFSARVSAISDVNKSTKTFTMRLEGADSRWASPPSTNVDAIGKHYLVRSFNNLNVRRHYTISSCMKKDTYSEYLKAIAAFKRGEKVIFND